jgi:hypothetical protein
MIKSCMKALLCSVALSAAVPTLSAHAETADLWGTAGDWAIRYDSTVEGCFAMAFYNGGAVLRFGIDRTSNSVQLLYGDRSWSPQPEAGKRYHLGFRFDDGIDYTGQFTAIALGGAGKVMIQVGAGEDFTKSFIRSWSVKIYDKSGRQLDNLTLRGSANALREMVTCQEYYNQQNGNQPRNERPQSKSAPREFRT